MIAIKGPQFTSNEVVTIVGAGLAGLLLANLLAHTGRRVRIFEAYADPPNGLTTNTSSINLALSYRGLKALAVAKLLDRIWPLLTPMKGRAVHLDREPVFHPYDLVGDRCIFSIRRGDLLASLSQSAQEHAVELHYGCRAIAVDLEHNTLHLGAGNCGRTWREPFDILIGADGCRSIVRMALDEVFGAQSAITQLDHGFLEFSIANEVATTFMQPRRALHVWPRHDFMLVALPNSDYSSTATLFVPRAVADDLVKFEDDEALSLFLRKQFPDITSAVGPHQMKRGRPGRILTGKAQHWHFGGRVAILGDAAHAMAPFFGQGVNCAFEDCVNLTAQLRESRGNWRTAFRRFEAVRKVDAAAICHLSQQHYLELRATIADHEYHQRRNIMRECQERWPTRFIPLYAMVSFADVPYGMALLRHVKQESIVNEIVTMMETTRINWNLVGSRIQVLLPDGLFLPDPESDLASRTCSFGDPS
jgi:kynurenine 3-monooxygenase